MSVLLRCLGIAVFVCYGPKRGHEARIIPCRPACTSVPFGIQLLKQYITLSTVHGLVQARQSFVLCKARERQWPRIAIGLFATNALVFSRHGDAGSTTEPTPTIKKCSVPSQQRSTV